METAIHIPDLEHISVAAKKMLGLCKNRFFFAFYGDLGSGKTTFIKAICKALGSPDTVASPTFSLVNEYQLSDQSSAASVIYHMDFYRLKNLEEALDIGVDEYFKKNNCYCFIEWPELIESLFPESAVKVKIERKKDNSRVVIIMQ